MWLLFVAWKVECVCFVRVCGVCKWVSRPAMSDLLSAGERKEGREPARRSDAPTLPSPPLPPVTHTPSVSVGLYPQPPAACLEQQQRETVGSQRKLAGREGGRRDSGREKRGGEREREMRWRGETLEIITCWGEIRDKLCGQKYVDKHGRRLWGVLMYVKNLLSEWKWR